MSKSVADFSASLAVLGGALSMYESGLTDAYRIVATELRKLLCDKDPLLPRVRPGFRLHKLHWTEVLEGCPSLADGLVTMMPGRLSVSIGGTSHFELFFARSRALIDVPAWVAQPFLSPNTTIRELIKSVADKEGAHSDPEFNDTLVQAKLVRYVRAESHVPSMVALGDYVSKWVQDSGAVPA